MTFYATHNMVFDLCNTGNIVKDKHYKILYVRFSRTMNYTDTYFMIFNLS